MTRMLAQVQAVLPEKLGAAAVEALVKVIMARCSWNQDVLDAVLRALEIPFASRRLHLRMEEIR